MIKLKLQNVIIVQKRMVIIMKVIGIDPAPSKKTVIYNDIDGFTEIEADKLKKYLDDEFKNSEEDILICWDAPLTGGKPINFNQKIEKYNPFYQRKIEQLINATVQVKGISTMGYAGCPHWSITQYCLGLPQIFQPEVPQSNLPFQLITEQLTIEQKKSLKGKYVIEVHPALALWLWLQDKVKDWNYKRSKETLKELLKKTTITIDTIKNDDYLDAYIAWKLGNLWQNEQDKVILVGNKNTGAILLPNVDIARTLQENLNNINKN